MSNVIFLVKKNIIFYRQKRGLSQEALSQKAGIHRAYIGFIESGRKIPNIKHLKKIADALEIHIKDLFEDDLGEY